MTASESKQSGCVFLCAMQVEISYNKVTYMTCGLPLLICCKYHQANLKTEFFMLGPDKEQKKKIHQPLPSNIKSPSSNFCIIFDQLLNSDCKGLYTLQV